MGRSSWLEDLLKDHMAARREVLIDRSVNLGARRVGAPKCVEDRNNLESRALERRSKKAVRLIQVECRGIHPKPSYEFPKRVRIG